MPRSFVLPQQRAFAWKLLGLFLAGGGAGVGIWLFLLKTRLVMLPDALTPLSRAEIPFVYTSFGFYFLFRPLLVDFFSYMMAGVSFWLGGVIVLIIWGLRRLFLKLRQR